MSCDTLTISVAASRPSASSSVSRASTDTAEASRPSSGICRDYDFSAVVPPSGPIAFSSGFSDGFY